MILLFDMKIVYGTVSFFKVVKHVMILDLN